ncbi:MAG: hypothetical protein E6Z08_01440 [Lacticaseibacillus rhamnosus]|uniref:hypothetical protein n=1 Tax=Lacticaseibacillus paracasei TaxID=1597 RepID=UPI000FF10C36|nr:hypothetical protein [Lacticaseibacillus paracasei]MDU5933674.1 hypothetical protein [Lacticaseibacillus rhamnosus]RNE08880.1 hypothetical protein FAM22280_02148 [Lacticaseibacillus paracasei]
MIKPYMISYDLDTPGQKYDELFSAIKQFGGSYIKLQDSFWLVRNNLTPSEMCEKLSPVLDGNDELFICELQNNYQGRTSKENWKFIRESIFGS